MSLLGDAVGGQNARHCLHTIGGEHDEFVVW